MAAKAASLAGHLQLSKLVCLYDENRINRSVATDISFSENCALCFKSYGWHTPVVDYSNDMDALKAGLDGRVYRAHAPSLFLVRTHTGFGSPEQDSFKSHGSSLGALDFNLTKQALGS